MKNKEGFTLLEVLLSLLILVAAVSIISDLQIRLMMRMRSGRENIDRVFLVKKELYDIFLRLPKKEKPIIIE